MFLVCSMLVLAVMTGFFPAQAGRLDLPGTRQLLDEWKKARNGPGELLVAVHADGRFFIRAQGYADIEKKLPFEDWTRIPLGELTRDLLHVGIDLAAKRKRGGFDPRRKIDQVLRGDDVVPENVRWWSWTKLLTKRWLPIYYFYSSSLAAMRPVGVVVREHVFRPPVRVYNNRDSHGEYAVLQYALERATGMPWSRYLKEVIAPALGLHATADASTMRWPSGLRVYGEVDATGKRLSSAPDFAEVAAAHNAWSCADDLRRYLGSLLQVGKANTKSRLATWDTEEDWTRSMPYFTRTAQRGKESLFVYVFHNHGLAILWFSNAPSLIRSVAVRDAVLQDLFGDPKRHVFTARFMSPGGKGEGSPPNRMKRARWRGNLRVGHVPHKNLLIEIALVDGKVELRSKLEGLRCRRIHLDSYGCDGLVELVDRGGEVDFRLQRRGPDLVGIATWHKGLDAHLPRRMTLSPSPKASSPYPVVPLDRAK